MKLHFHLSTLIDSGFGAAAGLAEGALVFKGVTERVAEAVGGATFGGAFF